MSAKTPIRAIKDGNGAITGFSEYQSTEFIAISKGGTGAITAAGARTALGMSIGTNVQAYDSDLTTIAALTHEDSKFIVSDGTNWVAESGATARTSLGLTIGTDVQAYDQQLADIAGLTPSDGYVVIGDGTNFVLESGSTLRSSLGLAIGSNVQAFDANLDTIAGLTPTTNYIIVGDGSDWTTSNSPTFDNLTVTGNLDIQTEIINSQATIVTVDDAFVKLNNGNGEVDAGIIVETSDTDDARVFYDVSANRWVLGENQSYDEILTQSSTDTITNKTISGSSNTITNIPNSAFTNSSFSVTDGSNTSAISLGDTVTFDGGAGVDISESSGTLSFTVDLSEITSDLNERIDDRIGSGMVVGGDGVTVAYDDNANTFTITTDLSEITTDLNERIDDQVAALITASSTSGIDITYDDVAGTLSFTTDLTEVVEALQDNIQNLFVGGTGITTTYNDTGNTLTIDVNFSEFDTDNITEGSTNLYYTDGRARGAISASDAGGDGSLSYNSGTGVVTYTGPSASEVRAHFTGGTGITISSGEISIPQAIGTGNNVIFNQVTADLIGNVTGNVTGDITGDVTGTVSSLSNHDTDSLSEGSTNQYFTQARARTSVSVTDSGGDGSLSYDNSTGIFTYTGPSASEVRAHLSAGTGITFNSGEIAIGQAIASSDSPQFTNLTLTGNLTVQGSTTTISTETLTVDDNIIVLNNNVTGSPTENAGIEIERGNDTNKTFIWNETTDKWTIGSETFVAGTFEGALTGNVTGTVSDISNHSTSDLSEGTNLYYTDARVESYLSGGTGIDFSSGAISIDSTVVTESSTDTLTNKTINFEDNTAIIEFAVTVSNASGSNKYFLDGEASASVKLVPGVTYRFNQSDGSNSGHPFLLSESLDGTTYTTGVTTNGTAGSSGAYTQIVVDGATADRLFYKCQNHSGMGGGVLDVQGSAIVEFAVTVANVGGNKYHLDGETSASIQLVPGTVYRFDQGDNSNSGHPIRLSSTKDGTHNSGSEYTTQVTTSGTPGNAGAYTQIVVNAATADTLYYYCTNHSGMGGNGVVSVQGLSLSDSDTDALSEGSSNLYFTNARARSAISVTDSGGDGSLSYNSSTGVITYTGPSQAEVLAHLSGGTGITISGSGEVATTITQYVDSDARSAISVTDSGGDGSLAYNSGTGVVTYTGPSASEVRAHFTGGTGVTLSSGEFSIGQAVATTSDVTFNDLTVSGDFTVSGTTTTVNTETIALADNVILINSNATGSATENGGIEIERGNDTNKTLIWNETTDKWTVGSETFVAGTFEGNLTGNVTGNVTGTVSDISNHSTSDLSEGTNLYFTNERVDDQVASLITAGTDISVTYDDSAGTLTIANTASLSNEQVQDIVGAQIVTNGSHTGISFAYDDANDGAIDATVSLSGFDTADLSEGTNLYYTNARADARIALANIEDLANVGFSAPGSNEDQKVMTWDNSAGAFALSSVSGLSGSGETNTASNIGTAGVGIFDGKVGEDLQFKKLNAGSAKITITDDTGNNEVDIDFGTVAAGDLSDVTTSGVTNGQALVYSSSNSRFEPGDVTATLSGLTDTTITSASSGQLIKYDGSAFINFTADTDDIGEGSTNLYYTDARSRGSISVTDSGGDGSLAYNSSTGVITYTGPSASEVQAHITAGTGVTISSGEVAIGQAVATTSDVTFNDLVVSGNLTVSGTQTTVNTETINLADNTITLNSNATGSASENGGIEIERGDDANKTLVWDESTDKWTVGSETFVAATFEGTATGLATSFTTGLTADSSPADDDLLIVYDTSAGVYKKVAKSNIGGGASGGLTGALDFTLKDGTEDDIDFLNLGATGTDVEVTLADGTVDPIQITSTSASATAFSDNDNDTKIQVETTSDIDDIRIFTAGTERVRIESDGVFDIKSAKLKINGGAGTNGQVLTTNGSGTISWADSGGSVGVNDLTDASTTGLATGDSLVYDGSNFVPQRPTNIEDADGDTRVHVEESADEDKVRIDTGGTERMIIDNNATMSAGGGFFIHRTTLASGESFSISANTGTVAAGPLDIEGTVDVAGTLVVV